MKNFEIDSLTIAEAKELLPKCRALLNMFNEDAGVAGVSDAENYPIGKAVFIRSVTSYYTGRLVRVTATDFVLDSAAWVASTGRFAKALSSGELDEVEPFPDGEVFVSRGGYIDMKIWEHDLPREVK